MPATKFICPDGKRITIKRCLASCPQKERCMFLPTLRAVAESLNRGIKGATVTELLSGVRETYLKKKRCYAVDPQNVLYSLHGQAVHTIHEDNTEGEILDEIRLKDKLTSGKFDLYGKIIDEEEGVLGDLKVTSSYKLAKALGIYKVDVPTGEIYKTGAKKGQAKTKNSRRRVLLLPEDVASLRKYRDWQQAYAEELGDQYARRDLVFATTFVSPISPTNFARRYFHPLLEKCGIKKGFTFHGLRHTHATLLLKQGVNPKIVQERLGHSSIKVTMDTYSHVLPDMQQQAVDALSKIFT